MTPTDVATFSRTPQEVINLNQESMKPEKRERRQFTKAFKTESVEFALHSSKSMVEIAGDLGIRPELLYRWKSEYIANKENAFPGSRHLSDLEK